MRFPDLPEALTAGSNLKETLREAEDCLGEALAGRMARREPIPPPSRARRGERLVSVPLYLAPKAALYMAMREKKISNVELGRRLGVSETVIRRMLDPKHSSKPEGIQSALESLGKKITLLIDSAA